jgi:hypothetical protein
MPPWRWGQGWGGGVQGGWGAGGEGREAARRAAACRSRGRGAGCSRACPRRGLRRGRGMGCCGACSPVPLRRGPPRRTRARTPPRRPAPPPPRAHRTSNSVSGGPRTTNANSKMSSWGRWGRGGRGERGTVRVQVPPRPRARPAAPTPCLRHRGATPHLHGLRDELGGLLLLELPDFLGAGAGGRVRRPPDAGRVSGGALPRISRTCMIRRTAGLRAFHCCAILARAGSASAAVGGLG